MSNPVTPTDAQIAKIVGNDLYLITAMRQLFDQAGTLSPEAIQEALVGAGNADNKAVQALDAIERLSDLIELIALKPEKEEIKDNGDLSPRFEHVTQDTMADLAPV